MKKSLAITMLAFLVAIAWSGAAAATDPITVSDNSLFSPSSNAQVTNSGNSINTNTNTNVVISANINTQLQLQNSPLTIAVIKKENKRNKHRHNHHR